MLLLLACVPKLEAPPLLENPEHDFDGDGFTEQEGDCEDGRADAAPGGLHQRRRPPFRAASR